MKKQIQNQTNQKGSLTMNTTNICKIAAFSEKRYDKKDMLNEMMALQREMVQVAFDGTNNDAKIWDVTRRLKEQNETLHHAADPELDAFEQQAKTFANLVKAHISGIRGERYVQQRLDTLKGYQSILRNVELCSGDARTELDFIVITCKGICILEVKNTKKNIFISEDGDYYRTGTYMCYEYNLREKMELREQLLRDVLQDAGVCNPNIYSMVVFTNNRIEIQNRCPQIHPVFLDQLPSAIYNVGGWNLYSTNTVENMTYAIRQAQSHETYAPDMDMQAFKESFVAVIDALETAKQNEARFHSLFSFIRQMFKKAAVTQAA